MFQNIGWPEILIVAVVIVVLFGGKYLFKFGKSVEQSGKEIKEATKDLKETLKKK